MAESTYLGYAFIKGLTGEFAERAKSILKDALLRWNITVNRVNEDSITLESIDFHYEYEEENHYFKICSFPGNCSALVLSGIEEEFGERLEYDQEEHIDAVVGFAEELCTKMMYATLYMSLTNSNLVKLFKKSGYKVLYSIMNPHSGLENFFIVKNFDY